MAIFNSFLYVYQRVDIHQNQRGQVQIPEKGPYLFDPKTVQAYANHVFEKRKNMDISEVKKKDQKLVTWWNIMESHYFYPLVNVYSLLLKIAIEIVSSPIKHGDFP